MIRARPFGWTLAQANNRLEEPDPALPDLPADAWVVGERSEQVTVKTRWATYTRTQINGQDIEPATIEQLAR